MTNLIGTAEAARRLGVSVRTMERWRSQGLDPKPRQIGGRKKYRLEDIQRMTGPTPKELST